jgi:hypothetical protein
MQRQETSKETATTLLLCFNCCLCPAEEGAGIIVRQSTSAARDSRGYSRAFPQATTAAEFPASVSDALALDSLLSPEERDIRRRVRSFMVGSALATRAG